MEASAVCMYRPVRYVYINTVITGTAFISTTRMPVIDLKEIGLKVITDVEAK